jgi:hypothetical protein
METSQTFLDLARIRILVLPVLPISKAKFEKYRALISSFDSVSCGDLTPDLSGGGSSTSPPWPHLLPLERVSIQSLCQGMAGRC